MLEAVQWNKKEAARVLDISRGTLYRKIVEYSLEPGTAQRPRGAAGRGRLTVADPSRSVQHWHPIVTVYHRSISSAPPPLATTAEVLCGR